MLNKIRALFFKPDQTPMAPEDMGEMPYVPTPEREVALKGEAFDNGFWAWKNRVDGDGPVDVFPPKSLTVLTKTPYELAIVQEAYVNGVMTAIIQEKSPCH